MCALGGECLTKGTVYEAKVTSLGIGAEKIYIGSTWTTFKERFNNHKASLRHADKTDQHPAIQARVGVKARPNCLQPGLEDPAEGKRVQEPQ